MPATTLIVIYNALGQVLLAMKKRGFGAGKWNGPGGKVVPNETVEDACKRETLEEVGLTLGKIEPRGHVDFVFQQADGTEKYERCFVFASTDFAGEPVESEEMKPQWFTIDDIPWKHMWEGDELWFKNVMLGETVYRTLTFDADYKLVSIEPLDVNAQAK